jgi:hypothetical protein
MWIADHLDRFQRTPRSEQAFFMLRNSPTAIFAQVAGHRLWHCRHEAEKHEQLQTLRLLGPSKTAADILAAVTFLSACLLRYSEVDKLIRAEDVVSWVANNGDALRFEIHLQYKRVLYLLGELKDTATSMATLGQSLGLIPDSLDL